MSNVTITNLPAALSVTGTDKIPAVQNGTTVYVTASQIASYTNTNYAFPTISAGYLIGNATAGTAVASAVSYSSLMDIAIGATQGQMIYRNVGNWVALDPGIIGQVLRTGGPNSDPFWDTVSGTGTVYSIGIGTNLTSTQTPITTTGTISTVMNPAFTTSVTTPSIYGGSSVSQTLLIQSTTGIGTSDSIVMKVGNNGATTAVSISSAGVVTLSSALPVTSGGTGQTSALTLNGVVYGSSTTAMATTAAGTTGQFLSGNTGSPPSWETLSSSAVTSISFGSTGLTPNSATTGDITVAGTLATANGGTNLTSFTANGAVYATSTSVLTTGTLPAISGGTGQSSYTIGDLLYADTTTTLAKLADVATGSVLISGGVGVAPSYSASPTLTTSLTTPLLIGGTTASSTLTLQSTSGVGTTDSILFKVGSNGATTAMTIGTAGRVGIGAAAGSTTSFRVSNDITGAITAYGVFIDCTAQPDVTTSPIYLTTSANAVSGTITTLRHYQAAQGSLGTSVATNQYGFVSDSSLIGATNNYAFIAGNTAAVTAGKTAYGYYSAVNTATGGGTTYGFYANGTAPNYFNGAVTLGTPLAVSSGGTGATTANAALTNLTTFTSTATAGATTTLTNTSTYFQYFTGTLTQTITLPVTSTLATGWSFHIVNNSTGNLTVNSSGGNLVITVLPGVTAMCTCIGTALTTAADWEAGYTDFSTATGTGSVVLSASPTLTGTTTATTLTATTLTATAGAGFQNMVVQITGTSASYSLPAAVQVTGAKLKVTIVGGGGQGGGTTTTAGLVGGGGGGGGAIVVFLTYVAGQNTLTYTVGPGGSGAGTNAAGTAGTASSIIYNGVTYTAGGGGGGPTATTTGSGTGGTATGGTLNIVGQNGGSGGTSAATANMMGNGGNAGLGLGYGAPMPSATGTGNAAASGYGGGGSGGFNGATATARAGGAGATGVVIIEY